MTRSLTVVPLLLAVLGFAGCAAEQDESSESSASSAESELTIRKEFYCGREGYDFDLLLKFSQKGTKLHVEWGLDNIAMGDGEIDPTYRPRIGNASFVRFTGFQGLDDAFAAGPKSTKILVEKSFLEGKPGRAKLQFVHADGEFEQSINVCE